MWECGWYKNNWSINPTILYDPWNAGLSPELLFTIEGWEHSIERGIGKDTKMLMNYKKKNDERFEGITKHLEVMAERMNKKSNMFS